MFRCPEHDDETVNGLPLSSVARDLCENPSLDKGLARRDHSADHRDQVCLEGRTGSQTNPVLTEAQFGLQKASSATPVGLSLIRARNRGLLRAPLHESTALLALEARPQRSLFEALLASDN
jgi:hypothetical protein